jgi:hypothetical protein|tara:strand:- start:377 stop:529 length:153 start_codon:yes stop_codon:yes gene_type:complete
MKELSNIEFNVLAVALDHMEEHLEELDELIFEDFTRFRLEALKTLRKKLL